MKIFHDIADTGIQSSENPPLLLASTRSRTLSADRIGGLGETLESTEPKVQVVERHYVARSCGLRRSVGRAASSTNKFAPIKFAPINI